MDAGQTSGDSAEKEYAWLQWLQQQCDAVMAKCQLPSDHAATASEMDSFFAGLREIESACATADAAASQLAALGLHALSDRLAFIRKDLQGARDTFKQPPSKQAGPLKTRMLELRNEQRNLQTFVQNAPQLVLTDAALAKPLLEQALARSEKLFGALKEVLSKLPDAAAELPLLRNDRRETRAQILMFQGLACTRLEEFDTAQALYEQALRELPEGHDRRPAIQDGIDQISLQRRRKRGF
jgi:tetratricopeptide (TPR) repeat protein